jgi:hypothetical protein
MAKRSRKKRAAFGGAADDVPAKSAESDVVAQQKAARWGRDWPWGLILFLAVFVTYLPVWRACLGQCFVYHGKSGHRWSARIERNLDDERVRLKPRRCCGRRRARNKGLGHEDSSGQRAALFLADYLRKNM